MSRLPPLSAVGAGVGVGVGDGSRLIGIVFGGAVGVGVGDGRGLGVSVAAPAVSAAVGAPPGSVGIGVGVNTGAGGADGDNCCPVPPSALTARMIATVSASSDAPATDHTFHPTPPRRGSSRENVAIPAIGASSSSSSMISSTG